MVPGFTSPYLKWRPSCLLWLTEMTYLWTFFARILQSYNTIICVVYFKVCAKNVQGVLIYPPFKDKFPIFQCQKYLNQEFYCLLNYCFTTITVIIQDGQEGLINCSFTGWGLLSIAIHTLHIIMVYSLDSKQLT